jgi:diacylglycerol kinase (ATP)
VVRNPRSHANAKSGGGAPWPDGVLWAEPATREALAQDLERFAAQGVDLLVVDGGDGTVRDVLSALPPAFVAAPPVLAVMPSGKTNILALDLGARPGWSLQDVLQRACATPTALKLRAPLEVTWPDGSHRPVRGFVFGLGAYLRATRMSKTVHRMGAFHGLSVAVTLAGGVVDSLFGESRAQWRHGVNLALSLDDGPEVAGDRFLVLASTLEKLPYGIAPFGTPRPGLKVLDVDAPPRHLYAAFVAVVAGRNPAWLDQQGYRRTDVERLKLVLDQPFVVDGEVFESGEVVVRRGEPLRFLTP